MTERGPVTGPDEVGYLSPPSAGGHPSEGKHRVSVEVVQLERGCGNGVVGGSVVEVGTGPHDARPRSGRAALADTWRALRDVFHDVVRGRVPAYRHWLEFA